MLFKVLYLLLTPCLLCAFPGYHTPWGKSVELISRHEEQQPPDRLSPPAQAMKRLIWFHQNIISPVDGPRSHYRPSSSTYMMRAIEKHGFLQGYLMGCDRLIRENDERWVYRTAVIDGKVWKIDPP